MHHYSTIHHIHHLSCNEWLSMDRIRACIAWIGFMHDHPWMVSTVHCTVEDPQALGINIIRTHGYSCRTAQLASSKDLSKTLPEFQLGDCWFRGRRKKDLWKSFFFFFPTGFRLEGYWIDLDHAQIIFLVHKSCKKCSPNFIGLSK